MLNKTVYTPHDVDYTFSDAIELNQANGERQLVEKIDKKGKRYDDPNKRTAIYTVPPRPSGIPSNHNRLTVAMDVGFWGDFLTTSHLVMAVRLKTKHYRNAGDNRCGAAAIGSWTAQHGFPEVVRGAAIEEPEINDQKKNQFHNIRSHCVTENKRYRLVLDSILFNGQMAHEIRIKDHTTGLIVYSTSGTAFSSFTHNYNTQSNLIMIATLAPDGAPVGGSYSNLVSYWSLAHEWVSDP
ncbi:hypothetical protein EII18_06620 [Comamonadaceae bacterium OH3737_COT-264]|nr:hypothetical protein EII18_06620 [Comamonadaceae bacterium OH3737_COT-264]